MTRCAMRTMFSQFHTGLICMVRTARMLVEEIRLYFPAGTMQEMTGINVKTIKIGDEAGLPDVPDWLVHDLPGRERPTSFHLWLTGI